MVVGLVEDDEVQAMLYEAMLLAAGIDCRRYRHAEEFRRRSGADSVDVVLLDWNLPGSSGIELLKQLRGQFGQQLPVVLLTANGDERDVVYGLQSGADDYIVKPPRPAELAARLRAAHRRKLPEETTVLSEAEPFRFGLREREVWLHGRRMPATEREFDLLVYMFQRRDRIVSREMLLSQVWKLGPDASTRSIDTYVSRLRRSFGLNGSSGWLLASVYQVGYRLARAPGE